MKFTALALAVSLLFAAPAPAAASADFTPDGNEWGFNHTPRNIVSPAAKNDPVDPRVSYSGFINVTYATNPQTDNSYVSITSSHPSGSSTNQMFVVETESGDGWHRTLQAIYSRITDFGTGTFGRAGLNLIGPSNYCETGGNEDDPCDATAYFLYAVLETGQVCINKRYEWPSKLAAARCEQIPGFEDGMPLNKLIGLQLVTYPRDDGDVRVVAYVDVPGDGQGWTRLIDYTDTPNAWPSIQPISETCQAKVTNGQTFSDSGKKCLALQGFGDTKPEVEDAGSVARTLFQSVIEGPTPVPTGKPTVVPSKIPSQPPSLESSNPTDGPSRSPSSKPSLEPSQGPSALASQSPTASPTDTTNPEVETSDPSAIPSQQPSPLPSLEPNVPFSQSPTPVPPTSQSPTLSPIETEGNDTEAPTSDPTSPSNDASEWVDYNIHPPALDYHFGSDEEYIRLDYVMSVPDYRVTVYDRSCTGPPLNDFFSITHVSNQRSDGDFDLEVNLDIIPETRDNPLLFNYDDEERPVYEACVWVDALRAQDLEPQFHMTKSFGITVEVASNKFTVETDVVQGGGAGDSDYSFVVDSGLEAYFCDEFGVAVNDALMIAGTGHYFCLEPTVEGAPIEDVVSLELEKDDTDSFVAIQNGNVNEMVRKSQIPDSDIWIIQLMIPPRFFFSGGSLVVSGETISSSTGRRLQAVGTDDSAGSFGATAAIGKMMNGVVQITYDVAVELKNVAVPQDEEELLTTAMVIDAAIHRILSDEAFAKTLSIGTMEIPMLRSSRRLDEGYVEVVFLVTRFVECDDAKCSNADELFAETIQTTRSTIGTSINDGTLAAEISKAAAAYNVEGFESLEVFSDTVNMSDATREVYEAASDDNTRTTGRRGKVLAAFAVATVLASGFAVYRQRRPRIKSHDENTEYAV